MGFEGYLWGPLRGLGGICGFWGEFVGLLMGFGGYLWGHFMGLGGIYGVWGGIYGVIYGVLGDLGGYLWALFFWWDYVRFWNYGGVGVEEGDWGTWGFRGLRVKL